jgi:hypothetical protein
VRLFDDICLCFSCIRAVSDCHRLIPVESANLRRFGCVDVGKDVDRAHQSASDPNTLLQRKDLIGYVAEVKNEIFNITLGLGDLFGSCDSGTRRHGVRS